MRASRAVIDPRLVGPDCELRGRSKPFQLCTASSTFAVSVCMWKLASLSPRTVQTWAKAAEIDLPVNGRALGLIEQDTFGNWQHDARHQIFEHGAAPRDQAAAAADERGWPAKLKPVLARCLAAGDG